MPAHLKIIFDYVLLKYDKTLYIKKNKQTLDPLHTRMLCTKFAEIVLGFEHSQSQTDARYIWSEYVIWTLRFN